MKFPTVDVLCFIIGWLFSGFMVNSFTKIAKRYTIGLARILKHLPETLGGIIALALILALALPFCSMFVWCNVAYDHYVANDISNAIYTFLINLFGCFYIAVITNDMPSRRK